MKNVAGVYAVGMPHVAVIQADFSIPVSECYNTLFATQECSILYAHNITLYFPLWPVF